ncbi:hypothetical protein DEI93_03290 [Curtobacterium sp. MCBD17_035]|uniref:hypothetical protein n=1 Tax=Curtobacterium sp. MCBD17_035 TaxID=2175673 RepID=UPI000DA9DC8F|nr:hypothetical protein [Curtobacterium sp. MCBD17_035]WIB68082.1 hypothetical protein DEI93_03290 [Curtobacterium sp. MCBD17_035]
MTSKALSTAQQCIDRAEACRETADRLAAAGDEWAAVCNFYAAFHVVRAALLADPIFTSIKACAAKHINLQMSDRDVTMHQARLGTSSGRAFGVNDLVKLLYPQIEFEYLELHSWSVNVRYNEGLEPHSSIGASRRYYETIRTAYDEGRLVA